MSRFAPFASLLAPLQMSVWQRRVISNPSYSATLSQVPLTHNSSLSLQNFGPEVKEKASIYVPAIGKVTIVVLLRNLLRIVHNRQVQVQNEKREGQEAPVPASGPNSSSPAATETVEPIVNGVSSQR